ncbi:MAG TPA: hypothetical protein VGC41_23780, partial [Kofleriaceae bacterium]
IMLPLMSLLIACGDQASATHDGATGGDGKHYEDAAIDAAITAPDTLFDTGLCADAACATISPGVMEYTPQFPLWADTAAKRRWFQLPAGTKIDTTDMDHWVFPVGTKFWKEFSRDGKKVETRLIERIYEPDSPLSWIYVSYAWNATEDATTQAPAAGVMNANGTDHDIPSVFACKSCHESLPPTRVLGFGAIDLDWGGVNADDITLHKLVDMNLLTTNPPAVAAAAPFYPIAGTAAQVAGLGYVHANCGHCHNPLSSTHNNVAMELRMNVAEVGVYHDTAAYRTAVNQPALSGSAGVTDTSCSSNGTPYPCIIKAGNPTQSVMHARFTSMPGSSIHMPQLGSEMTDPTGTTVITNWITNAN